MKKLLLSMAMIGGFMSANAQISTFPYTEDFESFTTCTGSCNSPCALGNGWSNEQSGGDAGEWITDIGGTSSSSTGPSVDYNPGTSVGNYLYFETSSPCYSNVTAILYSPVLDLSAVGGMNMIFAWHMYGSSQGTMSVDVSTDGGVTWIQNLWSATGDNGDVWEVDTVNLTAFAGFSNVIVRIEGLSSTSFTSDMAVDDFIFYEPLPLDAGVTLAYEPGLPSCNLTNSPVSAIFKNFGTDTLVSVDLDWTVNGVPQTTFNWTGSLPSGDQDTATLGTYSFVDGDILKIWTTNPNMGTETGGGPQNDTIEITIQSGLAGVYSIGATGDYLNFTDAVAALTQYGVCSAVTFQADNGTYNERITIGEISGASATNTITFESLNGLASQCILTYASLGTADNSVVALDGADYITFKNMRLENTGTTYGTVVNVDGGAHWNTFDGNEFIGDANVSTTSTNMALVASFAGNNDTMNTFNNNLFQNGSYGMYWYGVNTSSLEEGTVISNNIFEGHYYRGLHLYYHSNATVTNNMILGDNSPYTGSIYSMYFYYVGGSSMVTGNQVLRPSKYGYGIYMSNCIAPASSPIYLANNFFAVGDSLSTSTSYGIYSTGNSNVKLMNNSVNLISNGTSSRAMYITGGTGNDMMNNIFKTRGPGYCVYVLGGINMSDNNVFYNDTLSGGVMGNLGYFGGALPTLNDWQTTTGWDLNSAFGDPGFFSDVDLHTCNDTLLDGNGVVDSMLTMDVDGQMRDLSAFDIGADEFLGLSAFGFPSDTVMKCSTDVEVLGGWNPATDGAYLWSSGDTTNSINATNAGVYTVNVTTACGAAAASVVVENIPDAVASFTSTTSFLTGIFTSTSNGADSWSWDFGDGNTSNLENPVNVYPGPGQYIVTLVVSGPCGTDSITSIFEATIVGINDLDLSDRLEVYPNPNTGVFTLNLTTESNEPVNAEIMNAQGQLVWNKNYNSNGTTNETIDLSNLAKGMYVLRMTVNNQVAVKQIVIK